MNVNISIFSRSISIFPAGDVAWHPWSVRLASRLYNDSQSRGSSCSSRTRLFRVLRQVKVCLKWSFDFTTTCPFCWCSWSRAASPWAMYFFRNLSDNEREQKQSWCHTSVAKIRWDLHESDSRWSSTWSRWSSSCLILRWFSWCRGLRSSRVWRHKARRCARLCISRWWSL